MRGKWAAGIKPRFFTWVIKDKLAVCERPGGYARNHRKVRRREEILWIKCQGFTRVLSLLGSPHNLHSYDEEHLPWSHVPFATNDDPSTVLPEIYGNLESWLRDGERVVVHQEEVSDRLMGVVAGYLFWSGLIPAGAQAVAIAERLFGRQMGPSGRELVALVPSLPGPELLQRLGRQSTRAHEPEAHEADVEAPELPLPETQGHQDGEVEAGT